jgi:hypothetical protein
MIKPIFKIKFTLNLIQNYSHLSINDVHISSYFYMRFLPCKGGNIYDYASCWCA